MLINIGKGIELDVNHKALNGDVLEHVIKIGLRNILMDSHASITAEKSDNVQADSRAMAEKKLAALLAGDLRTSSTREGDPVKREAMRLATEAVNAAIRKAGKKVADYDAKVIREKASTVVDKFMVQARKNVEAAKSVEVDIEL